MARRRVRNKTVPQDTWIQCECEHHTDEETNWFIASHIGLSKKEVDKIDTYYCPQCRSKYNLEIVFIGQQKDKENQVPNAQAYSTSVPASPQPDNQANCFSVPATPNPTDCGPSELVSPLDISLETNDSSVIFDGAVPATPGRPIVDDDEDYVMHTDAEEDEIDYPVKAIIDVGWKGRQRWFRVEWLNSNNENWSEEEATTWIRERDLEGCAQAVMDYCTKKKLPATFLKPRGGADMKIGGKFNHNNWVEVDAVVKMIKQQCNQDSYKSGICIESCIGVEQFSSKSDVLSVLLHGLHFIVVVNTTSYSKLLVADGTNACLEDVELLERLSSVSGKEVHCLNFQQQTGVDHCGASAASIGLELLRLVRHGSLEELDSIWVAKSKHSKFKTTLHKEPSNPMKEWRPINELGRVVCPNCKSFSRPVGTKRHVMLMHMRQCNQI